MHAEAPRGAALVPVLALQRAQDVHLLEAVARFLERQRRPRARPARGLVVDGEVEREIVEADHRADGQSHAALDHVLELTDIARPVVGGQRRQRAAGDAAHVLLELPRVLANEVLHQGGNILFPIAQRRDGESGHVEPVVEILAERPRAHQLAQVHVGGGDHPHVQGNGPRAPQPLHLALLERAQQLGLEIDPQGAHLVEEERAPVGELEPAQLARVRAGEGPLLVAEHLRLEEPIRHGGDVDGDEGRIASGTLAVHRARHQLLPGPALPGDEHGGMRLRHLGDLLVEADHGGMPADQRVEAVGAIQLGPEVAHLTLEHPLLRRLPHEEVELINVEGLDDVVVRAGLDGVHRGAHVRNRRHQDHRDGVVQGQDLGQHYRAALAGQPHVEHGHVDAVRAHQLEPGGAVLRLEHLEVALEDLAQRLAHPRLVVDHEHDGMGPVDVRGIRLAGHGSQGLLGSVDLSTTYSLPPPPRWM